MYFQLLVINFRYTQENNNEAFVAYNPIQKNKFSGTLDTSSQCLYLCKYKCWLTQPIIMLRLNIFCSGNLSDIFMCLKIPVLAANLPLNCLGCDPPFLCWHTSAMLFHFTLASGSFWSCYNSQGYCSQACGWAILLGLPLVIRVWVVLSTVVFYLHLEEELIALLPGAFFWKKNVKE